MNRHLFIQSGEKRRRWSRVFLNGCAFGAALGATACAPDAMTLREPPSHTRATLQADGDPGVTVRAISSDGVDRVLTVPETIEFASREFDLRCIHGPQAGRLTLVIIRDALRLSTSNTSQPGQVTVFKVRQAEVSARVEKPKR